MAWSQWSRMLPQTLDPSTPEIMTGPPFCCSQLLIGTRAGAFGKITVLKGLF